MKVFKLFPVFLIFLFFLSCQKEKLEYYNLSSNEVSSSKASDFVTPKYGKMKDIDGNVYKTIQIGTQVWMAENLKVTRYNDGILIPQITDPSEWPGLSTGAFCMYDNEKSNYAKYGNLYNWYAVHNSSLAPEGWHIPSDAEWGILINYLGGINVAGALLKERGPSHWTKPNSFATNSSGFSALPGGIRHGSGAYVDINNKGAWWSKSEASPTQYFAYYTSIYYNSNYVYTSLNILKRFGFSVRCVMN